MSRPASASVIGVCRSSISRAASSRCSTKTDRWSWFSTARYTIFRSSWPSSSPPVMSFTRAATPRSSCTRGSSGARPASSACAACSPSRCGTGNKQTLFLARDRLGVKPLYCAVLLDGHFIFGSELKTLTALSGLKREIDARAVEDYFAYGYVPEPKTIYTQAHKLPPAHTLTLRWKAPVPAPRAYWDI